MCCRHAGSLHTYSCADVKLTDRVVAQDVFIGELEAGVHESRISQQHL